MDDEIRTNITSPDTWLRLLLIIFFAFVANVLMWLVWIIAGVQFIWSLITGKTNENLDEFSSALVTYLTTIFEYLVYRSDTKPFPFSPWESGTPGRSSTGSATKRSTSTRRKTAKESATEDVD